MKSSAVELLGKGEVPVVIMAGSRSEYLRQQLESLDALGHAQLVIISFNRPVLENSRSATLTKSFEAASLMRHLVIWPIWIRPSVVREGMNRHLKTVWMETMVGVWEVLRGYEGDAVFLEDDLVVSPDFFAAMSAASKIKQSSNMAVFAMGGWAGENTGLKRSPEEFIRKTWSAFPTMGYGFNRSLWRQISAVKEEITNSSGYDCLPEQVYCMHDLNDWSFAVSHSLRLRYDHTHEPGLKSFQVFKEIQLIQPLGSRVWHIGANSSIAEDATQKSGWTVSARPPWAGYLNFSRQQLTYSLRPGRFDYDGQECPAGGERSLGTSSVPCDLQQAIAYCAARPPQYESTDIRSACEDSCLQRLLACSSDPVVSKMMGVQVGTAKQMEAACSGSTNGALRYYRPGCRSWAIQEWL